MVIARGFVGPDPEHCPVGVLSNEEASEQQASEKPPND